MSEQTATQAALLAALTVYLRGVLDGESVDRAVAYRQYEHRGGGCSTCEYTEIRVAVDYITTGGNQDTYEYYGDMAKLIRQLT